jgi:MYXO-CTERM domain-containing protein
LPPPYPTNNGIYHKLVPRPSCIDGIENGEEEGIDCGGDCAATCQRDGAGVPDGGPPGDGPGPGPDGGDGGARTSGDDGCGCSTHEAGGSLALGCLVLLALLGVVVRRR